MESIFIQINQSFPISSPPIIPRTFNLMKLLSFQNMPFTVSERKSFQERK